MVNYSKCFLMQSALEFLKMSHLLYKSAGLSEIWMVDLAAQDPELMGGGCCQFMNVTNIFIICYCNILNIYFCILVAFFFSFPFSFKITLFLTATVGENLLSGLIASE